ncbi:MAG: pyridoxal 5'-phosphate synthase glutaminase subunit PdxT [candidate division Zixibacteria bacterium]|jgi:5'-phosphate synthase pdxT subunit|nr:pyridoxal 5'-phosphate synthase glutaminase subunit PdxT [candidate division Zixibacteria bacterium]
MTVQTNPIGILALQGDYFEHGRVLKKLGHKFIYVKTPEELIQVESLILPGGESTTMRKLAKQNKLWDRLKKFKGPMLGTCAGIILMAKEITGPSEEGLGLLDVTIARNAYGSQINSFTDMGQYIQKKKNIEMVFIRAPQITRIGERCEVIAEYKGQPVGVQQGNLIGLTFHPEISRNYDLIERFLSLK